MCGIIAIVGDDIDPERVKKPLDMLQHRGPDAEGTKSFRSNKCVLGHRRLKIIDLSDIGNQPMTDPSGRYWIVFNGEIYNYLELRDQLSDHFDFRTHTDTEVLLAAWLAWGEDSLDQMIGMFAFAIWDERNQTLFAARDRFGVKPLYYAKHSDGSLILASEIKSLHKAGIIRKPDEETWATYLTDGLYDYSEHTFWEGVKQLRGGHVLNWSKDGIEIRCWYDLGRDAGKEIDDRPFEIVKKEYLELLKDTIRLRFRSDVPIGINLSGGLDSSSLLALIQDVHGDDNDVTAFTFTTGDDRYDELPWVSRMVEKTCHPLIESRLSSEEVPKLAESVQRHQDEPFGGLPTLAYAKLFETARSNGITVLLDGQGIDEQLAGYDYYKKVLTANDSVQTNLPKQSSSPTIQGIKKSPVRPNCLHPEFRKCSRVVKFSQPFIEPLRNLQYRDTRYTKIPRALRFNDRVSMRSSIELREPFLDHRLFEHGFKQRSCWKIKEDKCKWLLRDVIRPLIPDQINEAPKRPLQTPQREWLKGPLKKWSSEKIEDALGAYDTSWLNADAVWKEWKCYCSENIDNSFYIWQWITMGLMAKL